MCCNEKTVNNPFFRKKLTLGTSNINVPFSFKL